MTKIGGVFNAEASLISQSEIDLTPPSGEQIKVTMTYAKDTNGNPRNDLLRVAPKADNVGGGTSNGTSTNDKFLPPVGSASGSNRALQPIYLTGSRPLYLGNTSSFNEGVTLLIYVQGVRVA